MLSDALKSLPSVPTPRLVMSGFGVWVLWSKSVNSTIHQTLSRFGGQKVMAGFNQSLWYFQNAQVFPALARLLLWAQIHPEPALIQVLPAKMVLGNSVRELSLSISSQLKEQNVAPGESFDIWVHPDLVQHVKTFPGLSVEQRPPIFGMSPENWHCFRVDPSFSLDADLSWFFFVKPMQDKENQSFSQRWKNYFMRLRSILERLGIRYIYQNNLLFFKIEGLGLLVTWCRELLTNLAQVKAGEQDAYWPCLYQATQPKGVSFNDELPGKLDFEWERLAPDIPHVPLSAGLLLREEFTLDFLDSAGALSLDALCQMTLNVSDSTEKARIDFPVSAATTSGKKPPCFYCGMKSHETSGCPSRQLFNMDLGVWNKIGAMTHEEMAQAVKALDQAVANGNLAGMPELLLAEGPENTILKAAFEITSTAQHRMLRMVWRSRGKELPEGLRQLVQPEGEYIWSALENTRSRNYSQAERMMQQAILRTSKSYQPHVLLGFIALEVGNHRRAEGHWQDARNLGYTPLQQSYLLFLTARLREIQGAYDQAHGLYGEAQSYCPKWQEPRYRQAVCITKKGFLDQAWLIFSELITHDPHVFNRILIDHELERGRSFLLSSLAGPWAAAKHQALRDQKELEQLRLKLESWFEPDSAFRKDSDERIKTLTGKSDLENYVAFSRSTEIIRQLQKDTDQQVAQAVTGIRNAIRTNIARIRTIYEEIVYFPIPRLIRKINRDYNNCGRILQSIARKDLHTAQIFKQAAVEMTEVEAILETMDRRMKSLKAIRDGSLFLLFLSKSFLWLALFGLLASIIVVPVLLHAIQESGSVWAAEWLTTQRWQVQRTVSIIMVFISGLVAVIWTSFRYEKQKQKYLAKKIPRGKK